MFQVNIRFLEVHGWFDILGLAHEFVLDHLILKSLFWGKTSHSFSPALGHLGYLYWRNALLSERNQGEVEGGSLPFWRLPGVVSGVDSFPLGIQESPLFLFLLDCEPSSTMSLVFHQISPWSLFLLYPPHNRSLYHSLQYSLTHWALSSSSGGFISTSSRISVTHTHHFYSVTSDQYVLPKGFPHPLCSCTSFFLTKMQSDV